MKEKCRYGKASWQLAVDSKQKLSIVYCLLLIVLFFSCKENTEKPKSEISNTDSKIYYCPMHPEIISDTPAKCPKPECMGMDLVEKIADTVLARVLEPVNSSVLANIQTTKPVFREMSLDVEANGYLNYDIRKVHTISTLYSGRIEKLYVKYAYQPIRKGQKLFEIYSPELVTAQQYLVYLLSNDSAEKTLIESAKQKLILLGFSAESLREVMHSGKVLHTVPVYSNYDGNIEPVAMNRSSDMSKMSSSEKENFQTKELRVKEGMYVMMGEVIFNVVDARHLVAMLQIKSEDVSKVQEGSEVEIKIENHPGALNKKIDFIQPLFENGAKTMMAYIYMHNSGLEYKTGSLVKAKIKGEEFETLWVPLSSIVDLGKQKMVWLKKNGNFIAKKVETGIVAGGMIEIADGLTEMDEIATEAHYLTDSEGFVKENEE